MTPTEATEYADLLYRKYGDTISEYLLRMTRNRHLAEDVTSETFERVMRALLKEGATAHENPVAWLRAIARNLLTDHYRRAASRYEAPHEIFDDDPEPHRGADVAVLEAEDLDAVHRLLECLTPGQRDALVLRTLDGYTTDETAAKMGRTNQAVRSLRHKAIRRLAEAHLHLSVTVVVPDGEAA